MNAITEELDGCTFTLDQDGQLAIETPAGDRLVLDTHTTAMLQLFISRGDCDAQITGYLIEREASA